MNVAARIFRLFASAKRSQGKNVFPQTLQPARPLVDIIDRAIPGRDAEHGPAARKFVHARDRTCHDGRVSCQGVCDGGANHDMFGCLRDRRESDKQLAKQ